ncbi:hypothetical protein H1C71_007250, partial [Ictidomys tridecemlineatus]
RLLVGSRETPDEPGESCAENLGLGHVGAKGTLGGGGRASLEEVTGSGPGWDLLLGLWGAVHVFLGVCVSVTRCLDPHIQADLCPRSCVRVDLWVCWHAYMYVWPPSSVST